MSQIVNRRTLSPTARAGLVGALVLGLGILLGYHLFRGEAVAEALDEHDHEADAVFSDGDAETVWTCSMHPQIRRNEAGDCPICGMELIPLANASEEDPTILTMTDAAVAMARVQTTVVGAAAPDARGGEVTEVELTGKLALDEEGAGVQAADVAGRIESLDITYEGQRVRRGQRVATLYAPQIVAAQRELIEAARLADLNPALLEATRAKLRNLRVPTSLIEEVERTGEVRERLPVYAQAGGTVLDKRVEVGDYVQPGQPLYTLADLGQVWAEFEAYEADLASVDVGDRVTFSTPAVPGEEFAARVSFVDPLVDEGTRTATIRAEVSNAGGRLKPGMLISGTLAGGRPVPTTADDGAAVPLTVPRTAVLWTGERSVVYVAVPDAAVPSYEFREVSLGGRVGEGYAVVDGLEAGERVVTNGAFSIDAAAQLNDRFSMMNRDVIVAGERVAAGEAATEVAYLALPDYTAETPEEFRAQLAMLGEAYLPIKNALVADELSVAERAVAGFGESLDAVDMGLVSGDAYDYWMEQLAAITTHAEEIGEATDIEAARRQFAFLSQALINALTAFGTAGDTFYVDHCPMALDDEGANWLSESSDIRNPYFGDAMLTCGSVVDTLGI